MRDAAGRRKFLGAASVVLWSAGQAKAEPLPRKVRNLLAEGALQPETAIGERPLNLPPELVAALGSGAQVRFRARYPERRNLAVFQVFLAAPNDPAPPSPELREDDPRLFAHLVFEIQGTQISTFPEMAVGLHGRVLREVKPSPFFPGLTGRIVSVQLGFQSEGDTSISMLNVSVAGDHVVIAREGRGRVELHP